MSRREAECIYSKLALLQTLAIGFSIVSVHESYLDHPHSAKLKQPPILPCVVQRRLSHDVFIAEANVLVKAPMQG